MRFTSMRSRITVVFIFVFAPFLLLSSHILLTVFRRHHMAPGTDPGWPPFVVFTSAAVLVFGILAWQMVGKTLSPIQALARQAEESSVEHTGTRLTAPSDDAEMLQLVATLNAFLDRMEQAAEEKARFYGAASHELRTPLQALSGHLEVALSQPRTAEEYAVTLSEAHEQTQRLSGLVTSILLLHQLQGPAPATAEPVDLSQTLKRVLEGVSPLAEARALTIEVSDTRPTIRVIPGHADILLRNLIENAFKYCSEGTSVRIALDQAGFEIENEISGEDIDPSKFLEAFFRQEASRSSISGGNGLGLAICRAVCVANHWTIALTSAGPGRILARVTF